MIKPNGGPAFPLSVVGTDEWDKIRSAEGYPGMTLRDYFAAKALAMWNVSQENIQAIGKGRMPDHGMVTRFCYDLADEMLKARIGESQT